MSRERSEHSTVRLPAVRSYERFFYGTAKSVSEIPQRVYTILSNIPRRQVNFHHDRLLALF